MSTTTTIINTIARAADEMDAIPMPPRPSLFGPDNGFMAAGRAKLAIQAKAVATVSAMVDGLSIVQRAKLDEILCRARFCDLRSDDEETWREIPDSIVKLVRDSRHARDLRSLADTLRDVQDRMMSYGEI